MDKKHVDWESLALFITVAREQGLSAAARRVGTSAPTLSRRMLALERSLGRQLFVRGRLGYSLTDDGQTLLRGLEEVEARIERLTQPRAKIKPAVKISAGSWTALFLMERLHLITGQPPDIKPCFITSEKVLSIRHREAVIGFRNQRPTEKTLVARKLNPVEFAPYMAAEAPERWIKVLVDTPSARWVDREISEEDIVCEISQPRAALDLALTGVGIALLPTFIGDAQDRLRRVHPPIDELRHEQWLVIHQDDRNLPEVRKTIDRIYKFMRNKID
ncbi:LysR family transcriptional regulator [Halomonas sp. MCCC 1A11036]|uniref:LysR family transcriptional regulator n=1 Tax=Billgrantia zhangzhouensis TaxID=2733481 RepID=A0ABS9AJR1_9GAMM|nr:LysR family transcriptional regulator [Halomonas zhangzhouensis]MCE8022031.1 LysR family transcriptional regulator [Halomonas zhangzhouensis]